MKAHFAKKLVEADPTLLQPENKERLLGEVDAVLIATVQ
jgi:hypothetical protein